MSDLNCNPNAVASRAIASMFNSFASSGIDLTYDHTDEDGIWLRKWVKSDATPKPDMSFIQRRTGDCVGSYLHVDYIKQFDVKARTKCLVRQGGTMRNPLVQFVLSESRQRMTSRDVALVSFDPGNRKV